MPALRAAILCLLLTATLAQPSLAQSVLERGTYTTHLFLHPTGTETYTLTQTSPETFLLTSTFTDRFTSRATTHTFPLTSTLIPTTLAQSPLPASLQMMIFRAWKIARQPSRLTLPGLAQPVEIKLVGHDAYLSHGRMARFARYTVANLLFGKEIVWTNDTGRIAAILTFANGLPQEIVLDQDERLMGELFHSGVRQQTLELAELTHQVPPIAGAQTAHQAPAPYAIVGARLIDGTGADPIERSAVLIRNGRIAAAGPQASVRIPPGTRILHAEGQTLLPGLWAMHTHFSAVELGPAFLAAGITTVRDLGGEIEFLAAVRRAIDQDHLLGPNILLAGLIDSAAANGSILPGAIDVETPDQANSAVDAFGDARFDQIRVTPRLRPDLLAIITAQSERRGLPINRTDDPNLPQSAPAQFPAQSPGQSAPTDLPESVYALNRELEARVQRGMTPMQAIQSATLLAARFMNRASDSGSIEPTKRADLLLIEGNPLTDITALRHVIAVATAGRFYSAKSLARTISLPRPE